MKKDLHPEWPKAPESSFQRLQHVLDIFEDYSSDMRIIDATMNQYAPPGEQHSWTGLTLGDLRVIADVAVGGIYTFADHELACQFGYTGAKDPRACCRCGRPLKGYDGSDCPKGPGRKSQP